jgi:hypothetical protein
MMNDPDFTELLEQEKRERKERRAKWKGEEKQKEREEYERDNIASDQFEPCETTLGPRNRSMLSHSLPDPRISLVVSSSLQSQQRSLPINLMP